MLVKKAFKFRIYPTNPQKELILKTFGCTRFVYNHFLNKCNNIFLEKGTRLSYAKCNKELTILKKEFEWLKEVDAHSLQSSLRNLDDSFKRFFKKQNKAPRFKSKRNQIQSYRTNFHERYQNPEISIIGNKIKLPKLGLVRFTNKRKIYGKFISATISRRPSGKFFVSILTETNVNPLPKTEFRIGIDMGIKKLATLSNGIFYENPKFFRSLERKLARAQRVLSRRQILAIKRKSKLSEAKNYLKQKKKVAKIHEYILNARKDYLDKISTDIIKNHDVIGIEDLNVQGIQSNRKLAKAVSEISWGEFRRMLEYKANWYGKTVIAVDARYTSQTCNKCGFVSKENRKTQSKFHCISCGHKNNADINAALNILERAITG